MQVLSSSQHKMPSYMYVDVALCTWHLSLQAEGLKHTETCTCMRGTLYSTGNKITCATMCLYIKNVILINKNTDILHKPMKLYH